MEPDQSRTVYDSSLFDVTLERWREHEREIVEHSGAVAIVAELAAHIDEIEDAKKTLAGILLFHHEADTSERDVP